MSQYRFSIEGYLKDKVLRISGGIQEDDFYRWYKSPVLITQEKPCELIQRYKDGNSLSLEKLERIITQPDFTERILSLRKNSRILKAV